MLSRSTRGLAWVVSNGRSTRLNQKQTLRSFSSISNKLQQNENSDEAKYMKTFTISSLSNEFSYTEATGASCPSVVVPMDEPVSMSGTGKGPTPLELSLMSLSGCETITARYVARSMKVNIASISCVKMSGTLDVRGMRGTAGIPAHFQNVDVVFELDTDMDDEKINVLKERVEKACPVYQLFKAAGVTMNSEWKRKQ